MFKGSIPALVTPMDKEGNIDKKSLNDLIEWHIAEKSDGLIVAGTTGESATLTYQEHSDLIATVVKQVAKRIPVIAGSGSNATRLSIELTENAKKAGADGCLLVAPYYNKPTQNGLFEHYKLIAESVSIPIILYNVPGRTVTDILPETVERLATISNIIGIKEATGKLERALEIQQRCPSGFSIYSGDDLTAMDLILQGGHGDMSVTANVTPRKMHDMCHAALAKNKPLAEKINAELLGLHTNLFLESNPIPTKWALHQMGKIPPGIRLPLLPLDKKYHAELQAAMNLAGIQL